MNRQYYIYIITNKLNTVLCTGVTNSLQRRIWEHREKLVAGFTNRYNLVKLVYFEVAENPASAILREKQIKAGSRRKKIELIDGMNRHWRDLYDDL